MSDQNQPIPEEILRAEQKHDFPPPTEKPDILGLPGLPANILELIEEYGPFVVLAMSVLAGFSAAGMLVTLSSADQTSSSGLALFGAFLGFTAAIIGVLAFMWLREKRRIGWNTLACALLIQFLGQILISGVSSILFAGIEAIIILYVMLQLRDSYTK